MWPKLISALVLSAPLWSQVGGISTFAGSGSAGLLGGGSSGDKGLATSAQFRAPQGVVSGPEGSLYVVDTGNNRVRRVGSDGLVDTIPGGVLTGSVKQIAVDNDGAVAYLESVPSVVRVIRANGTSDVIAGARFGSTPALRANLNLVGQSGIALVQGYLLVGELDGLGAIGFDGSFSLLIGDQGASVPIADLNSAFGIYGIAGDNAGGIYFTIPGAISSEQKLIRVSSAGLVTLLGDTGATPSGPFFQSPRGVAVDSDNNLYIADAGRNQVVRLSASGELSVVAGTGTAGFSGDGGGAETAQLSGPSGVAIGADRNLYIADTGNHRTRQVQLAIPQPPQQ